MSGLEVLGAASAAVALLGEAIGLMRRIHGARRRQKELSGVLDEHERELAKTRDIVQMVEDEQALQTAAVSAEILELNSAAKRLVGILSDLQSQKESPIHFFRLLVRGSRDEEDLAKVMADIGRAKMNLGLRISVAHVGMSRGIRDVMVVNTAILERVDARVRSVVGDGGLELAKLARGRSSPAANGVVELNEGDLKALAAICAGPQASAHLDSVNIISNNITMDQALQINGPIGEQLWRLASRVDVKNNKASGRSIQVNGGMSPKALSMLLKATR